MEQIKYLLYLAVIFSLFLLVAFSTDKKENLSPFEIYNMVNTPSPDFLLRDLSGRDVSLSSFKSKVVLLNFWATWCPPCNSDMASLNRFYNEFRQQGIEVIGVSTDNSAGKVIDYVNKNSIDFLILTDTDKIITKKYKVFYVPTTFLINRKGIITDIFIGERDWTSPDIKKTVEKLL